MQVEAGSFWVAVWYMDCSIQVIVTASFLELPQLLLSKKLCAFIA
jgi:hypothetical protein